MPILSPVNSVKTLNVPPTDLILYDPSPDFRLYTGSGSVRKSIEACIRAVDDIRASTYKLFNRVVHNAKGHILYFFTQTIKNIL